MALTGAAAVAMIGAPIVGGIAGNRAMKKANAKADAAMAKAMAELNAVGIPNEEAQKIVLQHPQLLFKHDPELEQYFELEPSKLTDIETDPRMRDAQLSALDKLQNLSSEGMTPSMQSDLRLLRSGVAREAQARDSAIAQNLAERGQLGTGQELAMRTISSQQAAQRQSEETDRQAKMANDMVLQSIIDSGQLGTQMRSQDFSEQAQVSEAEDARARINLFSKQNTQQRNVAAKNEAQLIRAKMEQDLENQRAQTANEQERHNKGLLQQRFDNEMRKATGIADLYGINANRYTQQGIAKATNYANMGQGVSKGIGSAMGMKG